LVNAELKIPQRTLSAAFGSIHLVQNAELESKSRMYLKMIIRKAVKILIISLILVALFSGTAFADENTDDELYRESIDEISKQLPDSVSKYLDGDMGAENGVVDSFLGIINDILGNFGNTIKDPVKLFGLLCAVMVLCAAAGFYTNSDSRIMSENTVSLVGSLAVAGVISTVIMTAVNSAISTIELSEQFVMGFIPVFAGLIVSSGQITSAALFGAGILAAANAASSVITTFVKPLTGVMLGLSLVSGIDDNGMVSVVNGMKKSAMWVMGIVTSLFVGIMGLQKMVTAQNDNLAVRTTKYLVGSSLPVIGSSVSEAVATVSGSFKVIRATVGSAGIIALCGIFLPELIKLLLCSTALSFSATVGDVIGIKNLSRSIRSIKGAIDIITAVLSFYFIALTMCTAIMISAGGN